MSMLSFLYRQIRSEVRALIIIEPRTPLNDVSQAGTSYSLRWSFCFEVILMSNKELVALKERLRTEHKKRVESIKRNGSWQSFADLQPVNEETYDEFIKLSNFYNDDNLKLSDERIEELLIQLMEKRDQE